MRVFASGFRVQLAIFRSAIGRVSIVIALPFHVLIFLSITRNGGRADLDQQAALAPALAGMWTMSLMLAGDIIDADRWNGVLDVVLAAPAAFFHNLLGRCAAVGALGLVCFGESWLFAVVFFDADLSLAHPLWFVAGLLATCLATAATATVMATVFVLGRTALAFKNALNYPVYVLGGVFVPVAVLPHWSRPLSRVIYLSWSSDLLRAATVPGVMKGAGLQLAMVLLLGALTLVAGVWCTHVVLTRVRHTGRVMTS
ncbi:ABC transporter permease [Kitasatospora sp. NPDC056651]|uniref:ABC transporter permease n=1 Tax=Kitasatospora sp. NPDC056651 TaxID=3345892 RepID=UPI00367823DD